MREIEAGHYERKQLASRSRLISWSHSSRFDVARELLAPLAGRRLLDYGSGDGTLLKLMSDAFPSAVGADPIRSQVADARRRFGGEGSLSFYTIAELHERYGASSFDAITCMEVLEHCVPAGVEEVLDDLARLVTPEGTVIISVPIEIGPSLIIKQFARRLAALRGMDEYKWTERYSLGELGRMAFATSTTAIPRPVHTSSDIGLSHGHKGFNWRGLERRIEARFSIDRRLFSPLGFLGGFLSSQAWFVCSRRPDSPRLRG